MWGLGNRLYGVGLRKCVRICSPAPLNSVACGPKGAHRLARGDRHTDIALRPDGVSREKRPVPGRHLNRLGHLRRYWTRRTLGANGVWQRDG